MIDIVIISYSGGELLEKAVKSLVTVPIDTEINIIVQQSKQSIPKNVNEGFAQVKSNWFVLFNDDWEAIQEHWLDDLLIHAEPSNNIGFVSCRIKFDNGLLNHRGYKISSNGIVGNLGRNEPDKELEDTPIHYAHPILINTQTFKSLGGYDNAFRGSQFADIDFVYRTRKSGYQIFFAGSVPLLHHYNENKATNAIRERNKKQNSDMFRKKHGFGRKMGYLAKKPINIKRRR